MTFIFYMAASVMILALISQLTMAWLLPPKLDSELRTELPTSLEGGDIYSSRFLRAHYYAFWVAGFVKKARSEKVRRFDFRLRVGHSAYCLAQAHCVITVLFGIEVAALAATFAYRLF